MNRTYDVFVDNGLFVLAYYLNKDIKDITDEDIFDNIDMMCEKIIEFTGSRTQYRQEQGCEKYSGVKEQFMLNSALVNNKTTIPYADDLKKQTENNGKECCAKCGEYKASNKNNFTRKDIPNSVANTFYNFSNNLQMVNMCNTCFLLTVYSILNVRINNLAYLYNSDDDEFMYDYTYERQEENKRDILLNAKKEKSIDNLVMIEELLGNSKLYKGYIQIYKFKSGEKQALELIDIRTNNVKLLSNITKSGLLNEFKQCGLTYDLITDKIRNTYLNKIVKDDKLICSKELFDMLNKEVNNLNENIINVIKNICEKLEDTIKVRKKLKLISTFKDYERYLVELAEEYSENHDDNLYTVEEYLLLDNKLKYNQIKNLLIVSLMQ